MKKKRNIIFNSFDDNNINLSYKGNFNGKINYSKIISDKYKVQGFTVTDKYYLISAYSILKDGSKSRIYFYDKVKSNYLGYVVLNNSSHVGGITYDNINKLLFVTGSRGKINVYDYKFIINSFIENNYFLDLNCVNINLFLIKSDINISNILKGNVSAATIYYYNNCLYVATCSSVGSLVRVKLFYSYENRLINSKLEVVSKKLPACIQGLIVFDYEDSLYFIISQSYGRLQSTLKLFFIGEDIQFVGQKRFRTIGIEGIDMNAVGLIKVIFENGAKKSSLVNINYLNNSVNMKLEKKYVKKGEFHQKKLDNRDLIV